MFNWGWLIVSEFWFITMMVGHNSMQIDMMLGKKQRVLHFDPQAEEKQNMTLRKARAYETSKPTFIETHFLQQGPHLLQQDHTS